MNVMNPEIDSAHLLREIPLVRDTPSVREIPVVRDIPSALTNIKKKNRRKEEK